MATWTAEVLELESGSLFDSKYPFQHPYIKAYSRSQKVGTSLSSCPETKVEGTPALIILNPCSNFPGFTLYLRS